MIIKSTSVMLSETASFNRKAKVALLDKPGNDDQQLTSILIIILFNLEYIEI